LEKFRFKCPVCGLLGYAGALEKDVPVLYFKVHQSRGRGTLRTEEVTGKPEWRQALAEKMYKVIATLVAEGILNRQQVELAAGKGQTDAVLRSVKELYDSLRR